MQYLVSVIVGYECGVCGGPGLKKKKKSWVKSSANYVNITWPGLCFPKCGTAVLKLNYRESWHQFISF